MLRSLLPLCLVLAACSDMPELNAPAPPAGPAPEILPLSGLVASMPAPGAVISADPANLGARAAALRARAAGLRAQGFTSPAPPAAPAADPGL